MITFWIILVASTVESGLCGAELRKYGELVKPGGTWEQSGVVLLFYQINYAASLVKIRADFRNNYPLYIQAWTALGIVNGSRQCELNNQWHYRSNRIGVATVSLPENSQMEINPGQYIGIFIPADTKIPIQFEQVYPAYNLFGSEYILASTVIIPGVKVLFGRIGYINKFSIEFYILPDVPTSTMKSIDSTSNHVTTNEESTQTATDAVEQTESPRTITITTTSTERTTTGVSSSTDPSTGGKQKTVIIISVVVTVGVVLLFIISLGCVLFWRKRPVSEPQTDYRQMNNPVYGIESDLSGFGLSDEVSAQKNISPTTNIYDSIRI